MIVLVLILAGGMSVTADAEPAEWQAGDSLSIDSVSLTTENIFNTSESRYGGFLYRLANSLHVVTRRSVVRRELLLKEGDRFDTSLVNESVRNLRRLPYLFKTEIALRPDKSGRRILHVTTSDRWSTGAAVSYRRVGGRYDLDFLVEESNLFGRGIMTTHRYAVPEGERRYYQGDIADDRFFNAGLAVSARYSDDPRSGRAGVNIARPFYSIDQQWGGELSIYHLKNRTDYYLNGLLAAQDRATGDQIGFSLVYRIGPRRFKTSFVGAYAYLDERSKPRKYLIDSVVNRSGQPLPTDVFLPPPPADSIYHYVETSIRFQQLNYVAYRRINRFQKPEDVSLGLDTRMSFGTIFDPVSRKRGYHVVGLWPQWTLGTARTLSMFDSRLFGWFEHGRQLRRLLEGTARGYWRYHDNHTLAGRIRLVSDRLARGVATLYLDENGSIRGYTLYSYYGEDRLVLNAENRIFTSVEFLTVALGGVLFTDMGNIWNRDGRLILSKTRVSVGFGLRLGLSRSARHEIIRVDVAYATSLRTWQISAGTGQFF